MADVYSRLVGNPIGDLLARNVGLPRPADLDRHEPGQPLLDGRALLGAATGGRMVEALAAELALAEVGVDTPLEEEVRGAAAAGDLDAGVWSAEAPGSTRYKALVFDATGIDDSTRLRELWSFFHPSFRSLEPSGRVIVFGTPPEECKKPREATSQRALEGFTRSLAKEARAGATAQLVYVSPGAEGATASSFRFLLSPRSAYVSGQVVRIGGDGRVPKLDWQRPLQGKIALVTGASQGIGEAIARTLARDGAHVVGLDVPAMAGQLERVCGEIGGSTIAADITGDDVPGMIAGELEDNHEGVDVVVHNAGVTRDKTIVGMDEERWSGLIDINLSAAERINDELLGRKVLNDAARVVCVSSISGIAGNAGQSNYATSKAGVIGMVESMAPVFAKAGATINAVAPGFIETRMTAAMPIATREAGRRLNSMRQGGLPVDVAETIAWFASPASGGLNGNLVRVCGQSLIGA